MLIDHKPLNKSKIPVHNPNEISNLFIQLSKIKKVIDPMIIKMLIMMYVFLNLCGGMNEAFFQFPYLYLALNFIVVVCQI